MILLMELVQLIRRPLKIVLFTILLTVSTALVVIGSYMWFQARTQEESYLDLFVTIGTVEQEQNAIQNYGVWDAADKKYIFYTEPVYDSIIQEETLGFFNDRYITQPEKRPFYGADMSYLLDKGRETDNSMLAWNIVEISPVDTAIPDHPMEVKIVRTIWGNEFTVGDTLLFCDHNTKDPPLMDQDKTYIVSVQYQKCNHEGYNENAFEYTPTVAIKSTQYTKDGLIIEDKTGNALWEEVTDGFYDSDHGKRWLALADSFKRFGFTCPVLPTNNMNYLMAFYNRNSYIKDGREINESEFEEGKKVCLIASSFARENGLKVSGNISLPLYFVNYKSSASQIFMNGGTILDFSLLNAEGGMYEVFENSEYEIIGIYENSSSSRFSTGYEIGNNGIIVPSHSVSNKGENNILAFGPMMGYTTEFQIENDDKEAFLQELNQQESKGLKINIYDHGYEQLKSGIENTRKTSLIFFVSGCVLSLMVVIFYLNLFIQSRKGSILTMRSLGIPISRCKTVLLAVISIQIVICFCFKNF